jgi:hypothetical protein
MKKWICAMALILAAVFLIVVVSPWAASPARWSGTMASIGEKTDTVLRLTTSSALAAAGLSALPDDMATPVAEKLADFSEYFLLVLCVLYAEKFLLTVLGVGAFRYLIPLALGGLALGVFWQGDKLRPLAARLILVSLALYLAIPLSIGCSDLIYDTYRESIDQVITSAEEIGSQSEVLSQEEDARGPLDKLVSGISQAASALTEKASSLLKEFVESLAVLIVTACIIPLVVLALSLWAVAQLIGIDVKMDRPPFPSRRGGKAPEK